MVPRAGRDSRFWSPHTSSASVTSPSGLQHKRLALVSVLHLFVVNHLVNQVLGSQKRFCVVLPSGFCLWKFSNRDLRLLLLLPRLTRFPCLSSAQLFSLQDSPSHPTFCLSPNYCPPQLLWSIVLQHQMLFSPVLLPNMWPFPFLAFPLALSGEGSALTLHISLVLLMVSMSMLEMLQLFYSYSLTDGCSHKLQENYNIGFPTGTTIDRFICSVSLFTVARKQLCKVALKWRRVRCRCSDHSIHNIKCFSMTPFAKSSKTERIKKT